MSDAHIGGTAVNYYYVCQTELWYFLHHLSMEHNSDLVAAGRFIHENAYEREKKELRIDGISIDFVRNNDGIELHEIKKSDKMEKAHEMQTKYYLMVLKEKGILATAVIDYPTLRKCNRIELRPEDEDELRKTIQEIRKTYDLEAPPEAERKRFCPTCSYYELCWSE